MERNREKIPESAFVDEHAIKTTRGYSFIKSMDIRTKRKQTQIEESFIKCECRKLGQNCDEDCLNALDYRSCTMSNCS